MPLLFQRNARPRLQNYRVVRRGVYSGLASYRGMGACNPGETHDVQNADGSWSQVTCDASGNFGAPAAPATASLPTTGPYGSNVQANQDYWATQAASGNPQVAAPPTMSYNDLLAQAKLASCDPRDWVCVANNTARQAAVEQFWVNSKMNVPAGTQLTFSNLTPAQVNEFHNPNDAVGGNIVDMAGVLRVGSGGAATIPQAAATDLATRGTPPPGGTAATQQQIAAGAPGSDGTSTLTNLLPAGFSLSSIPWWGWLGAGAFALFAMKGGR